MKLIFVGDPMCSWCYGFGKEMTALAKLHPELPLEIVVGGLRAGATDVLDEAGKNFRLVHWARVEEASGLPFNRDGLMARQNFVYDTEPICRAVVAARVITPDADLLAVFRALQHGFYVEAVDTTDGRILARLASNALIKQGCAVDVSAFYKVWEADSTIALAKKDFARSRSLGVRSFPVLLLEMDGEIRTISPGYAHVEELERNLQLVLQALHIS
ncbi:MAG: DsbA family protein [Herminiimonas sp.]|uniref:DsbA family protein n=1 Tax=Herminiimonas sp. TaxID=1926289 RepID=UPI00271B75B9|nr:DsbA family protein [Herminiimonas sp.]MDO9421006.1 DsbA family protein [Herminiimonas sp.]